MSSRMWRATSFLWLVNTLRPECWCRMQEAATALHAYPLSVDNAGSSANVKIPDWLSPIRRSSSDMILQWSDWKVLKPYLEIVVYNDTTMENWLDKILGFFNRNNRMSFRDEYELLPCMIFEI